MTLTFGEEQMARSDWLPRTNPRFARSKKECPRYIFTISLI
jgi:hypothetical protein